MQDTPMGNERSFAEFPSSNPRIAQDGTYKLVAWAVDKAGNVGPARESEPFIIDKSAPKIESLRVSGVADGSVVSGDGKTVARGKILVTAVITDATELKGSGTWVRIGRSVSPNDGNNFSGANVRLASTGNPNEYAAEIDTALLGEKSLDKVHVYLRAEDKLGNTGAVYSYKMNRPGQDNFYIVIDNLPPAIGMPILDGRTLRGNAGDAERVVLNFSRGNNLSLNSVVLEGEDIQDGDWTYILPASFEDNILYTYTVEAFDALNNRAELAKVDGEPLSFTLSSLEGGGDTESPEPSEPTNPGETTTIPGGTASNQGDIIAALVSGRSIPGATTPLGSAFAAAFTTPVIASSPASEAAVLGDQDVLGTTDTAALSATANDEADDAEESNGLAWYWWLIIAAAGIGAFWWIIAAMRKSNDEE